MSEVAMIDPAEAIDRAADPGEFVLMALDRGKTWLAEALQHGDLDALVDAKGYAATLRVAVMQKQLGKDAELAATELVRRAERCIGLGIRQGQAAGTIRRRGERGPEKDPANSRIFFKPSPTDYADPFELSSNGEGIYRFTDGVSDEQFEQAIEAAKAEGNLSRANVVRKATGVERPAKRHPLLHKTHHIKAERVIDETINALDGLVMGLHLVGDVRSLDAEKRLAWVAALDEPLRYLNRFKKELSK